MNWTKMAEVGLGLFLIGPGDELLLTTGTGGTGAAAAPAQLPISALLGAAMVAHGFGFDFKL